MKNQKGQVLIIVILITLVASVIVLAVASRSVTDVKISTTSEESARAFSAAEAGVEIAVEKINSFTPGSIGNVPQTSGTLSSGANFTYSAQPVPVSGKRDFLLPNPLSRDLQTFQVYLTSLTDPPTPYNPNEICLLWGSSESNEDTAIEATVIYDDGGIIKNERFALGPDFDTPNNLAPCDSNNKTSNGTDNNLAITRTFRYAHKLTLPVVTPENRKVLRLRLLKNPSGQYVGVRGLADLPVQGYTISSTGSTDGGTTRKIEVFRSFSSLPAIFDFVLFSGAGISR